MSFGVWVAIGVLIAANALYVAAEFGAVGVRRSRVRRLADDGSRLARQLLPYVDTPDGLDRYVAASQVGITLSSLVLGALAQATIAVAVGPLLVSAFQLDPVTAASTAAVLTLILLTMLQVVAGELIPKSLALQFPTPVALGTVVPMRWSLALFRPLIAVLNGSANGLLRLLGLGGTSHRHIHSPAEIDLLIAESRDGGLLEPDEQRRLHRALQLSLRSARDLMVPLDRVAMISADASWEEAARTATASPFSRLPVYRGSRQTIIGMLRVKDMATSYFATGRGLPVERLLRPLARVPENVSADQVLSELRGHRAHLAIVVDAAGRPAGLIAIQDVLGAFLEVGRSASTVRSSS